MGVAGWEAAVRAYSLVVECNSSKGVEPTKANLVERL